MQKINDVTDATIGLSIEVHRELGPGLPEVAYERALCIELTAARVPFQRQVRFPVLYKGQLVAQHRPDLIVADLVVVEIKSVEQLHRVHTLQMLTYLKVTGKDLGLILNFNEPTLVAGIKRVVRQPGRKTL